MLILVIYHMDTFFGIGYSSEHIHGGYPCTGGYVQYTDRGGGDIIWGTHGEYPFAGEDVCNLP